jgi:hypothetical protein
MDDNRVLSGARQQHLMSCVLEFGSFTIIILITMIRIIYLLSYILYLFWGIDWYYFNDSTGLELGLARHLCYLHGMYSRIWPTCQTS